MRAKTPGARVSASDGEGRLRGAALTTEQDAAGAPATTVKPARRSTQPRIAEAIDLGWRVAALYTLSPAALTSPSQTSDDMLLNRRSLSPADRLELELQAIAGVARRAEVPLTGAELDRLLALADRAAASEADEKPFRDELAQQHIAFEKRLWMTDEPTGKAYELGNFLSDTWNRIVRPQVTPDAHSELLEIFGAVRVERIKLLLDDLQARIDPIAAHTVNSQLDLWHGAVAQPGFEASRAAAKQLTAVEVVRLLEPVERQTIIWRQMLTGDKEPEAFIGHVGRSGVRDELTHQLWKRYGRWWWLLPIAAALGVVLGAVYNDNKDTARALAAGIFALAGTFGITRAAMIGTVRRGLQSWGDLMWNRALTTVICRQTSLLHELFPPVDPPNGLARLLGRGRGRGAAS
jgi:hypothetical protein